MSNSLRKSFYTNLVFGVLASFFAVVTSLALSMWLSGYVDRALAASPPTIINYQGKLFQNSLAVTTTQSMKLLLYNAATAGNVLYTAGGTVGTPTAVSVEVTTGTFSVSLGGSGTNAISDVIFRDNTSVYLEVTVGAETMSPRKQIVASPYAFNSRYLDGVGSKTVSTTTYIPISDGYGNFLFNQVTSTFVTSTGGAYLAGSSTLGTAYITSLTVGNGLLTYLANTQTFTGLNTFSAGLIASASSSIASSLNVSGNLNASSSLFVGGFSALTGFNSTASSTIGSTLSVTGATTVSSSLSVLGLTSLTGGFLSTASSTVNAGLSVSGALNASSTFNANGLAVLTSGFIANASSSIGGAFLVSGSLNSSSTLTANNLSILGTCTGCGGATNAVNTWSALNTFTAGIIANASSSMDRLQVAGALNASGTLLVNASSSFSNGLTVGVVSTTPSAKFTIYEGSVLALGTQGGAGVTPASGAGTRLMWIPNKSAFRAGYVNDTQWDNGSIGSYSTAFGNNNTASGDYSTAVGSGNTASGVYSFAGGAGGIASGAGSFSVGVNSNAASGDSSVAFGNNNTASGGYTFTVGSGNVANNTGGIAMGNSNTAGLQATAIGTSNVANGTYSMAFGRAMTVSGHTSIGFNLNGDAASTLAQANTMAIMSGKVGIGTVTPAYTLSVSGTIGLSGTSTYFAGPTTTVMDGQSLTIGKGPGFNQGLFYVDAASSTNGGAIFASGSLAIAGTSGGIPLEGAGARLMWVPTKRAFRVGEVLSSEWDNVSIGNWSFSAGYNNRAVGQASMALGQNAFVESSAAIGAFSIGYNNYTQDGAIGAIGYNATAKGTNSMALGNSVTAGNGNTPSSYTFGDANSVGGQYSVAVGTQNTVDGAQYGMIFGNNSTVSGQYSLALGWGTYISGQHSAAINLGNSAMTFFQNPLVFNNTMAVIGGYMTIGNDAINPAALTGASSTLSVSGTLAIGSPGNGGVSVSSTTNTTTFKSYAANAVGAVAFDFDTNFSFTSSTAGGPVDRALATFSNAGVRKLIISAAGNVYASSSFIANSNSFALGDVAEYVNLAPGVTAEAGDVLVVAEQGAVQFRPSGQAYEPAVAGVISDTGRFVMGAGGPGRAALALTGLVLVKASTENGPIKAGDYLVTGSKPGMAMRYDIAAGRGGGLVGMALEPLEVGSGKITILVNKGLSAATPAQTNTLGLSDTGGQLAKAADLNLAGQDIFNVKSLRGLSGAWELTAEGKLKAKIVEADQVAAADFVVRVPKDAPAAVGQGTVAVGQQLLSIKNEKVTEQAKIFVTFRNNPQAFWWISKQEKGAFEISLSQNAAVESKFDYWIIGVAVDEETAPEAASVEAPITPEQTQNSNSGSNQPPAAATLPDDTPLVSASPAKGEAPEAEPPTPDSVSPAAPEQNEGSSAPATAP